MDLREGFPLPLEHVAPLAAKIADPAPASLTDPVFVTLDSLYQADQPFKHGPLKWQSRDASSLPQVGDACVVVELDTGELWVVAWSASGSSPPAHVFQTVQIPLDTPDAAGNGYMGHTYDAAFGFSHVRLTRPVLPDGVHSSWEGAIAVPADIAVGGAWRIEFLWTTKHTGAAVARTRRGGQSTLTESLDRDYVYTPYDTTGEVFTPAHVSGISEGIDFMTLHPGGILAVKFERDGGNVADTLADDLMLVSAALNYESRAVQASG